MRLVTLVSPLQPRDDGPHADYFVLVFLMRAFLRLATGFCLTLISLGAEAKPLPVPAGTTVDAGNSKPCAGKNAKECGVSRKDFKKARKAFDLGIRLKDRNPIEALSAFNRAISLIPRDAQYISARDALVQRLLIHPIQDGNPGAPQPDNATAVQNNQPAPQRLPDTKNASSITLLAYREPEWDQQEIPLRFKPGLQSFHLSGDARGAYNTIGGAFGIEVAFDSSVPSTSLRLNLEQITFEQAMNAVALVTHSFWTPVSHNKVLIAADTANKRKELERWLMRTFYLPETATPQDLTDIANLLRTLFELHSITQSSIDSTITVRGPASVVRAATKFLETLGEKQPQVMLDFEICDVNSQMLRDIGLTLPSQFSIYSIPQYNLGVNTNPSVTSGSANQANGATIPALISLAQQQNSLTTSFQPGVPTVGGGETLMGIQVAPLVASFSQNDSRTTSLSQVTLRGAQGKPTTFRMGTRFPVITASYSGGSPTAGTGTTLGTFPTVTYQDLGITITVTPKIHQEDVTLDLSMEMNTLGSQLFNGIPTISQQTYKGIITVENDQPAVVAVSLSRSEIDSVQGIPGVRSLPVLGSLTNSRSTQNAGDELLVIITPHRLEALPENRKAELLLPTN